MEQLKELNKQLNINLLCHNEDLELPNRGYKTNCIDLIDGSLKIYWWRTQKSGIKDCRIIYYLSKETHSGAPQIYVDLKDNEGSLGSSDRGWDYFNLNDNIRLILKETGLNYNSQDFKQFLQVLKELKNRMQQLSTKSYNEFLGHNMNIKELNKQLLKFIKEDQYEGPNEEEQYTVIFTDGTKTNDYSFADGLYYKDELISEFPYGIDNDKVADAIRTHVEVELNKEIEDIIDGMNQSLVYEE